MSIGLDFLGDDTISEEAAEESLEQSVDTEEVEETEETEDTEGQEDPTTEDEDEAEEAEEGLEVIDIDGEEVTLKQIREWKSGDLREQDYTKETMALAEERKSVESKFKELNDISEALIAGESDIKKALIGDLDEIDLKSLRDEDYSEYLKVKETIKERQEKFDSIKEKAAEARKQFVAEQGQLLSKNLGWDDESKSKEDIAAFKELAKEVGIGDQDMSSLVSAKVMAALIDYAKLKKKSNVKPPKGETKKVRFKKSSSSKTQKAKPRTTEEGINSFFD